MQQNNMLENYLRELSGLETYYTPHGCFLYMLNGDSFDVGGFYIKPEFRNGIHSKNILKDIIKVAKDFGCTKLTACVVTDFRDPETAMYNMLRCKFKFSHIEGKIIYFYYPLIEEV